MQQGLGNSGGSKNTHVVIKESFGSERIIERDDGWLNPIMNEPVQLFSPQKHA